MEEGSQKYISHIFQYTGVGREGKGQSLGQSEIWSPTFRCKVSISIFMKQDLNEF